MSFVQYNTTNEVKSQEKIKIIEVEYPKKRNERCPYCKGKVESLAKKTITLKDFPDHPETVKLIDMLIIAGKYLKENGEREKASIQFRIAQNVMNAFEEDFIEEKWFKGTVYEYTAEQRKEIERLLNE